MFCLKMLYRNPDTEMKIFLIYLTTNEIYLHEGCPEYALNLKNLQKKYKIFSGILSSVHSYDFSLCLLVSNYFVLSKILAYRRFYRNSAERFAA